MWDSVSEWFGLRRVALSVESGDDEGVGWVA